MARRKRRRNPEEDSRVVTDISIRSERLDDLKKLIDKFARKAEKIGMDPPYIDAVSEPYNVIRVYVDDQWMKDLPGDDPNWQAKYANIRRDYGRQHHVSMLVKHMVDVRIVGPAAEKQQDEIAAALGKKRNARIKLAKTSTKPYILEALANAPDDQRRGVHYAIASNVHTPGHVLAYFAEDPSRRDIQQAVAENISAPPDALVYLSTVKWAAPYVAANTSTPVAVLAGLAEQYPFQVAMNSSSPLWLLGYIESAFGSHPTPEYIRRAVQAAIDARQDTSSPEGMAWYAWEMKQKQSNPRRNGRRSMRRSY